MSALTQFFYDLNTLLNSLGWVNSTEHNETGFSAFKLNPARIGRVYLRLDRGIYDENVVAFAICVLKDT
jgi:hypothetical protein